MYRKNLRNLTLKNVTVKQFHLTSSHLVMDPQDADRMVNNVDTDQTAV